MKTARRAAAASPVARVFDAGESSLLDVLDHVLSKGVMATGDLTLGVAGVDLVYVRLSALLCAADRVLPAATRQGRKRRAPAAAPSATPRRRSKRRA